MNQTVENIFAEMFAPNAIPIEVIELYDKVNFFVARMGLGGMKRSDLCMIAAIALSRPPVRSSADKDIDGHELVDTSEDTDIKNPVEPVEMYDEDDGDDEDEGNPPTPVDDLPPAPPPSGKMDAPKAPDPGKKRKAKIELLLMKMTNDELFTHAKDVCGISEQKLFGKKGFVSKAEKKNFPKEKIIKAIMEASK